MKQQSLPNEWVSQDSKDGNECQPKTKTKGFSNQLQDQKQRKQFQDQKEIKWDSPKEHQGEQQRMK